jgi:hypothetical protein
MKPISVELLVRNSMGHFSDNAVLSSETGRLKRCQIESKSTIYKSLSVSLRILKGILSGHIPDILRLIQLVW